MNLGTTQSFATSVTAKGQVTIPATIRQYLGIKSKDKVKFDIGDDGLVRVVPATSRLAAIFQSNAPVNMHKDDKTLRLEFEDGVAETVLRRDTT